jgi:hypothetical protein
MTATVISRRRATPVATFDFVLVMMHLLEGSKGYIGPSGDPLIGHLGRHSTFYPGKAHRFLEGVLNNPEKLWGLAPEVQSGGNLDARCRRRSSVSEGTGHSSPLVKLRLRAAKF